MHRIHFVILAVFLALLASVSLMLRSTPPAGGEVTPRSASEPAGATPTRVAHSVASGEAEALLRAGRPWRAAQLMREHLSRHPDAAPELHLLAAEAEAGWGGWREVRELLEGRPWLATVGGGEGLFLLARALEAEGEYVGAAEAYSRYLDNSGEGSAAGDRRRLAELRGGLVLMRVGDAAAGRPLLAGASQGQSGLQPWIDLLSAESLATRGDTAAVRGLVDRMDGATFGHRARRARVVSLREAGDHDAVYRSAVGFRDSGTDAARAEFSLLAGRAAIELGQTGAARTELRRAIALAPRTSSGLAAARELEGIGPLTAADRLSIARVYDQHGQKPRAAELYREWLAAGAGSAEEQRQVRLSLGRALFDAGSVGESEEALRPLVGLSGEIGADALYLTGRAQFRSGRQSIARSTYLQVAERFTGTQQGAEALYLVADMHHEVGELPQARNVYRRVADEFRGRDRSGLALMRLAGMAYLDGQYAEALRHWDEYRRLYPRGQLWLQSSYWAGRALERSGDRNAAAARYREVRARDPLSYYALLSAERLGLAFWPPPLGTSPGDDAAARRRVDQWMSTVDLLRDADLHQEAEAEIERLVRSAGSDRAVLYPLAEELNERGYTVRGIRLGLQLQTSAGGLNPRLLRILYPFPYRNVIEAEARELGLDPLLSAALIRQESMFSARISSPVGARGLMQVMPQTGRAVAAGLGIGDWDEELLFQPEINVHLGTTYLAEQMRRYDASLPAVFSAYNAGPHRIDVWRNYPEYGDEELFTERIPFRETRDYVKILTRNLAIYQALYGGPDR